MTSQTNNYAELISEKIKILPLEKQKEVLDFVDFLVQRNRNIQLPSQRIPNLKKREIWISDDFNEPLSDSFWLGEE